MKNIIIFTLIGFALLLIIVSFTNAQYMKVVGKGDNEKIVEQYNFPDSTIFPDSIKVVCEQDTVTYIKKIDLK